MTSGARFLEHAERDRIEQLWARLANTLSSPLISGCSSSFVDGATHDQTVRHDTATALRLIDRDNGAIVWHDAISYGVGRVLPELVADGLPIYLIRGTAIGLVRWSHGEPTKFSRATAASALPNRSASPPAGQGP